VSFLHKYDSVPQADLQYLSLEDICVAAGVDTKPTSARSSTAAEVR
jgi:hypothetical protein